MLNLIDVGSSTIKLYQYENRLVQMIDEKSIYFKNGFTNELGISEENKNALFNYFNDLKDKYKLNSDNTRIYATGIFRKMIEDTKNDFVSEFYKEIGLHFNIISHELENLYLEKAMEGDYNNKKVLIINMGGKTTELVTINKGKVTDVKNIEVGVAELLNEFPHVNDKYSTVKIEDIVAYTKKEIEDVSFDTDYDCAIFTGGELRFERLAKYNLVPNTLFDDPNHPYMITFDDFVKANYKIFFEMTLQDLYDLMPHNPKWMDGARPGAVLPQAIFERCNIKIIVPSDMNLINGVVKEEIK